jgi:hypothetical protein
MIDEKIDQNGAPQEALLEAESGRTLVGKVARLPNTIREQLNQRLSDGQTGIEILAWLNELPVVKRILAAQFEGAPITERNLVNWRKIGYARWLQKQEPIQELKWLGEAASDFSRAGAGKLAHGAAALAAAWLLDYMRRVPPDKCSPADLTRISFAATCLQKGAQADAQLKLAEKRILQKDEQLLLTRDRDQRNAITIGLRLLGDARAKAIEGSSHSYAEKIELLGLHTFGEELWQARYVPETKDSANQPPK